MQSKWITKQKYISIYDNMLTIPVHTSDNMQNALIIHLLGGDRKKEFSMQQLRVFCMSHF